MSLAYQLKISKYVNGIFMEGLFVTKIWNRIQSRDTLIQSMVLVTSDISKHPTETLETNFKKAEHK